jgi:hypothetical protein
VCAQSVCAQPERDGEEAEGAGTASLWVAPIPRG